MVSMILAIILCVAGFVVGSLVFFFIGSAYRKKFAEKEIGSAEEEAKRIINDAIKGGESKKREPKLTAKTKNVGQTCRSRNAASSRKRNPSIRSWKTTRRKKKIWPRKSFLSSSSRKRSQPSSAASWKCWKKSPG